MALGVKWDEKMEPCFIAIIGHYKRYKFDRVRDLLRVMRNKLNHFREFRFLLGLTFLHFGFPFLSGRRVGLSKSVEIQVSSWHNTWVMILSCNIQTFSIFLNKNHKNFLTMIIIWFAGDSFSYESSKCIFINTYHRHVWLIIYFLLVYHW